MEYPRKIKTKERKNGMKYCTFCKPERVDAIYRDCSCNLACKKHYGKLEKQDDNYMSEADYQTWGRL